MKIKNLLFVFYLLHFYATSAQDFVYIHKSDKALILDSNVIRSNTVVNNFITKPEFPTPQNTLFFRLPILFENVTNHNFYCYWSWLQNLQIEESTFTGKLIFNHVGADTFFLTKNSFLKGLVLTDEAIQNFKFSKNALQTEGIFRNMQFKNANFDSSDLRNCNFDGCTFENASFVKSVLKQNINTQKWKISGKLNLDDSKIYSNLILRSLVPNSSISLNNTMLPDTIDLSNSPVLNNIIDLTQADYSRFSKENKCSIFLKGTNLSKLNFEYYHFRLLLVDPQTGKKLTQDEIKVLYQTLLKVFKEKNQTESYELLSQEYKNYQFHALPFLDQVWETITGGPANVFWFVVICVAFFTVINLRFYKKLNNEVYTLDNFSKEIDKEYNSNFKKIGAKVYHSFAYTIIVFFSFNIKIDNLKFGNWKLFLYLLTMYVVGVTSLFFMANIIFHK